MDFMTIIGGVVGIGVVIFILSVGHMMHFLLNPEAIILIFGGTFGSVMISYPWSALRHVPSALGMMFFPPKRPAPQLLMVWFGELAIRPFGAAEIPSAVKSAAVKSLQASWGIGAARSDDGSARTKASNPPARRGARRDGDMGRFLWEAR